MYIAHFQTDHRHIGFKELFDVNKNPEGRLEYLMYVRLVHLNECFLVNPQKLVHDKRSHPSLGSSNRMVQNKSFLVIIYFQ